MRTAPPAGPGRRSVASTAGLDGDGRVQVAVTFTDASYGGLVALWDMAGENHDEHHDWPMFGHDIRRGGTYSDPRPNRPANLTQQLVDTSLVMSWSNRSEVEENYVIERSSTGEPWSYETFATLPADSTEFTLVRTQPGFYRVRALRFDTQTGNPVLSRFVAIVVTHEEPPPPPPPPPPPGESGHSNRQLLGSGCYRTSDSHCRDHHDPDPS